MTNQITTQVLCDQNEPQSDCDLMPEGGEGASEGCGHLCTGQHLVSLCEHPHGPAVSGGREEDGKCKEGRVQREGGGVRMWVWWVGMRAEGRCHCGRR